MAGQLKRRLTRSQGNTAINKKRLALAKSGAKFAPREEQQRVSGLDMRVGMVVRFINPLVAAGPGKIKTAVVTEVASDRDMVKDRNLSRLTFAPSSIIEGHEIITRMGLVDVPGVGPTLIPDTRYNSLERYKFTPGKIADAPSGCDIMDRLLAGFAKNAVEKGFGDLLRPDMVHATRRNTAASKATPWSPPSDTLNILDDTDDGPDDGSHIRTPEDMTDSDGATDYSDDGGDPGSSRGEPPLPSTFARSGERGRSTLTGSASGGASSGTAKRANAAGTKVGGSGKPKKRRSKNTKAKTPARQLGDAEVPLDLASHPPEQHSRGTKATKVNTTPSLESARLKVSRSEKLLLNDMAKRSTVERREALQKSMAASDEAAKARAAARQARAADGIAEARRIKKKNDEAKIAAAASRKASVNTGNKGKNPAPPPAEATATPKGKAGEDAKNEAGSAMPAPKRKTASEYKASNSVRPAVLPSKKVRHDAPQTPKPHLVTPEELLVYNRVIAKLEGGAGAAPISGAVSRTASLEGDGESDGEEPVPSQAEDLCDDSDDPGDAFGDPVNNEDIGGDWEDDEEQQDPPLADFRRCVKAVHPWKSAILSDMRDWRDSLSRLQETRADGLPIVSQIQNKWKDKLGNKRAPLVDNCTFQTANRWKRELAAIDKCHNRECCDDDTNVKVARAKHPPPSPAKKRVKGKGNEKDAKGREKGKKKSK